MPKQVLIVDAVLERWERLTGWLQAEGYRVEHATDGNQAIEKIREGGFAVAIVVADLPQDDVALTVWRLRHTGEMFNPGVAIVLIAPEETTVLQDMEMERLKKALQDIEIPSDPEEERR